MIEQTKLFDGQKKVIVFIDGSNLLHALFKCYQVNFIDILTLSKKLCNENRRLKQVRYYYSNLIEKRNPTLYKEQQSYIQKLKDIPIIDPIEGRKYVKKDILPEGDIWEKVKSQFPNIPFSSYIEKGLDVRISVDLVILAIKNEYDTAILVSGDSDFVPAIEIVKSYKKKVQIASFDNDLRKCYDLKNNASSFINLDHFIPAILNTKKP